MNIRNRTRYFSSLPEGQAPANPAKKMTSRLYFLVLAGLIAYLLFYAADRMLYLETRGQVEVGRYLIHANLEGTIDEILVSPGDSVLPGQTLATIQQPPTNPPSFAKDLLKTKLDISQKEGDIKHLEESLQEIGGRTTKAAALPVAVIKLDHDLRQQEAKLAQLKRQQELLRPPEFASISAMDSRLLELSRLDRSQATKSAQQAQQLAFDIAQTSTEITSTKRYRQDLVAAERQALSLKIATMKGDVNLLQNYLLTMEQGGADVSGIAEKLTSPIKGEVQAIFKLAGEQTSSGEAVLALRSPEAKVAIHGYFPEDQLICLTKDKRVKLTFADNSHSVGVISNHYSIASSYREKLKDAYIPIQSAVLVEILPLDQADEARWRSYDRLDVAIKVRR